MKLLWPCECVCSVYYAIESAEKKVLIVSQYSQTKPHKTLIAIVEISNCMMAVMPRYGNSVWCISASPNVLLLNIILMPHTIQLVYTLFLSALLHSLLPLVFDCAINTILWFRQQQQQQKYPNLAPIWFVRDFRSSLKTPFQQPSSNL